MWKNVEPGHRWNCNTAHALCICITTATDTHSEYVILLAFPRQPWLRERASMLHLYVHCLSCNVILPSTPLASKRFFSFTFSSQNPVCPFVPYHACHVPRLLYSPWFDHPDDCVDDYQSLARNRSTHMIAINPQFSVLTYLNIPF